MAQHDYNIANQTGADFRADLNNALSAIATTNSGATEPTTTFAHQLWVDTGNNVLKIRNGTNSAWITTGISITTSNILTGDLTGNVTGNLTGNVTGNVTGDLTGNADTATTLATARTISLSGDVAGSASFDGSGDITITTTAQIDSIALGTDTTGDYVESMSGGTGVTVTGGTGEGSTPSIAIGQAVATTSDVTFNTITATDQFIGDIRGAVRFNAKADGALSKGDVVYISGVSGDNPTVAQAKADDASKMPAFGFAAEDANDNAFVEVVTFGTLSGLDTSGVSVGQVLYVSATAGAYTTTAPSGESAQIQNIGKVQRSHASAGSIKVGGAGRSNATPNLDDGKIFIGNASNQSSTATLDTSIVVENTNLYYTTARANSAIDARVTNTFINNLTGVVADTATALATARTISLSGDIAGSASFDGTSDITITSTIQPNSIALGTDTVGNYVQTITGTANKITVTGSGSESADVTLTLPDDVQIADSLTVAGDLTVNGTLTSLDTTNLDIADNLFQLNAGLTGSPVNDSGMLINRGNQNNGIFMWDESVDKFTLGLTTADGTTTGNITLSSLGTLVANVEGDLTGTIQTAAQPNITSLGTLTGLTTTGDINFGDNDKAVFGASSDLQIYHDGSNSYIDDAGTGNLHMRGSNQLLLQNNDGTKNFFVANNSQGWAKLYHNNTEKLATSSTGVDITGTLIVDTTINVNDATGYGNIELGGASGGYVDFKTPFNDDFDARIFYGGTNFQITTNIDNPILLRHNSVTVLETSSTGIDVTGTVVADGLTVDTNTLYVDSTNNRVGIGTTSLNADLHIGSASATGDTTNPALQIGGATTYRLGMYTSAEGAVIENKNGDDGIQFRVKTAGEAMRIDGGTGNVGISTSAPSYKLDVDGDINIGDGSLLLETTSSGFPSTGLVHFSNNFLYQRGGSAGMIFSTAGGTNEALRFNSSGQVIINGSAPLGSATFTVDSDSAAISVFDSSAASGGYLQFRNNNTPKGLIGFGANSGANSTNDMILSSSSGSIDITIPETAGAAIRLEFGNNDNTTRRTVQAYKDNFEPAAADTGVISLGSPASIWKDIYLSGKILLGTTSSNAATGTIVPLGYRGREGTGGTERNNFNIAWTGSVANLWIDTTNLGAISTSSDYRIKRNVETQTDNALSRVMKIRPVTYQMNNYEELFKVEEDDKIREGFIAHELAEIIPSAVEGKKDSPNQIQSLKLDALVSVLTKAIQEQQEQIEELKEEIQNLKG